MKIICAQKYLIIFFLILTGCAIKQSGESNLQGDNTFEDFFVEFAGDADFQKSRITFPLEYLYYEEYEDSLKQSVINVNDWKFIDFGSDSLAFNRKVDAFNIQIVKKNASEVEYLRKGIDNGISIIYHFRKIEERWFLIKIVDQSN